MTDRPLVSIITPSYNQAPFLEQTIQSVLSQGYSPLEYIVVDGASSDGSLEIIRRYAERLAWWASEPDSGQAEAINKGLRRAQGEVVAWLNSDDLYLPGAIASAVHALQAEPGLGMVFGDAITIDAQGGPLNKLVFGEWGLSELIRFRIICQPSVFMRRRFLEQVGLLDNSYHFLLDHHLWVRMARRAPLRYLGALGVQGGFTPLAAARYHPGAKNVVLAAKVGGEIERLLDWMQNQPDLAALIAANRRQVFGGAYRLTARYLLDGGLPAQALRYYWKACLSWPSYALKHAHRMAYAALCLLGLDSPVDSLRDSSTLKGRQQLSAELRASGLANWPGLCLEICPP
jgi:glycosyltransferase involved in cell wall biosynthesis